MLALFDDTTARLLCSAAIPLTHIQPGVHYNLKLALPAGAWLFVTLCLVTAPQLELSQWRQLQDVADRCVHVRLAEVSDGVLTQETPAGAFGIVACFDVDAGSAGTGQSQKQTQRAAEAQGSARSTNSRSGSAQHAARSRSASPASSKSSSSAEPGVAFSAASGSTSPSHSSPESAPQPIAEAASDDETSSVNIALNQPASRQHRYTERAGSQHSSHSNHRRPSKLVVPLAKMYTPLAGTRDSMNAALEKLAPQRHLLQRTLMPIASCSAPDQLLWPVLHGALRALEPVQMRNASLAVSLHLLLLTGHSVMLGSCSLPLSSLPLDGHGDIQVFGDLPVQDADGAP